jgi:hypothetical protein
MYLLILGCRARTIATMPGKRPVFPGREYYAFVMSVIAGRNFHDCGRTRKDFGSYERPAEWKV